MASSLVDTDVFIAILKGNAALKTFVESSDALISSVVYLELIQGAKDQAQVTGIERYLTKFELIHFDKAISWSAIRLIRDYSKGYGLMAG